MDTDLAFAPAVELARMVAARELSPVELAKGFLDRIDRLDGDLGSIVTLDERALHDAAAAEATAGAEGNGPFHGVPTAIKDLHLTAGLRTTFGTASMAAFVPTFDDESVARMRRAGFVILGKTNAPELGTVPFTESALLGVCRNPWNRDHTPGGSSGGAAAAVAAGLIPLAHASDGGGSIRIPASNCGLVGLKPSRGRVSGAPLHLDAALGFSTAGPIGRSVADVAALLDVLAGPALGDPWWAPPPPRPFAAELGVAPGRLRVGLVTTSPIAPFHPATVTAAEGAARLLEELGHDVEPLTLPLTERFRIDFELLWAAKLAAAPIDHATLEPFNAELAARGHTVSAATLLRTATSVTLQAGAVVGATHAYDLLLSPTIAKPPARIGAYPTTLGADAMFDALAAYVGLAPVANVTGQPAISLPLGWHEGLPIGVMLTGRPADETTLLRVASQLEQATGWTSRHPRVSARGLGPPEVM